MSIFGNNISNGTGAEQYAKNLVMMNFGMIILSSNYDWDQAEDMFNKQILRFDKTFEEFGFVGPHVCINTKYRENDIDIIRGCGKLSIIGWDVELMACRNSGDVETMGFYTLFKTFIALSDVAV